MLPVETIQIPLSQEIPWWATDFVMFFGVLYFILFIFGSCMGYVIIRSLKENKL